MRLKELRESHSLTQSELGEQLGLSKSAIGNYENGHRQPDMQTLSQMADYFHVTIDYIVGRSNLPTFDISAKEDKMLQIFRTVPEDKQVLLLELFIALSGK